MDSGLGREFHPAVADCGCRAPLAPRVARLLVNRRAALWMCQRAGYRQPMLLLAAASRKREKAAPNAPRDIDKNKEFQVVSRLTAWDSDASCTGNEPTVCGGVKVLWPCHNYRVTRKESIQWICSPRAACSGRTRVLPRPICDELASLP